MRPTIKLLTISIVAMTLMSFQLIKTQLNVTIRNGLGNIEEEVNIRLFETEADYLAEKNAVAEGFSDSKGVFKFKELKAISYYVIARKGDMDNSEGGEQTGKLEAKRINKVTIIIQ